MPTPSPGRGGSAQGGEGFSPSHMALQRQVFVTSLGEPTLGPGGWVWGVSELGIGTPDLPHHVPLEGLDESPALSGL